MNLEETESFEERRIHLSRTSETAVSAGAESLIELALHYAATIIKDTADG